MLALMSSLAWVADRLLGEPPTRWHPLVAFGTLATALERRWNQPSLSNQQGFVRGFLALLVLVLVPVLLLAGLLWLLPWWLNMALQTIILYLCLGGRSLHQHAVAVAEPLLADRLSEARSALSRMVSRDTHQLSASRTASATLESVLENGNDAIFASLFWFAVAGAPAALAHRLINTLDAMWGYRTPRHEAFGKSAARLDDGMNFLPARLSALTYALVSGHPWRAWRCWQRQAARHDSPNAGVVMAAGAGALGLRLGGSARYAGIRQTRPLFGTGRTANASDITSALTLLNNSTLVWLAAFWLWALL